MSELTDLQLAEKFRDLVDVSIANEPCDYSPNGSAVCTDLLDSDTCDGCKWRLAYWELEERMERNR